MKAIGAIVFAAAILVSSGCSHQPSMTSLQLKQIAETAYFEGDQATLIALLKEPALSGELNAAYFIGAGLIKSKQHQPRALELLQASAATGNSDASFQLAQAFENGWGTEPDLLVALDHYRAAIANAPNTTTLTVQSAEGAPFVNAAGEFDRLRGLAQTGDVEAQYRLGTFLDHGDGAPQNKEAAIKWYKAAASQGHELANLTLGYLYCRGIGTARDVYKATLYLQASNRNAECN